jgi:hypothetical protein
MEAPVGDGTYAICHAVAVLWMDLSTEAHWERHGTTLLCWHAWEYDYRTGANEMDDGLLSPIGQNQGDDILIDVP